MKENYKHTIFKELVEHFIETNYPDLNDQERSLMIADTSTYLYEDEDLKNLLKDKLYEGTDIVYRTFIEPMQHTKFTNDKIIVEYGNDKIVLEYEHPYALIHYKDYTFPAYWLKNYRTMSNYNFLVSDKLHELMTCLPDEEIKYPYAQMWAKLSEWKYEGYSEKQLEEIEKIIEGLYDKEDSENKDEYSYLKYSYDHHIPIDRLQWPNWIDHVISFEKDEVNSTEDELIGNITLKLRNEDELTIKIEARDMGRYDKQSTDKNWKVHSWSAITRAFPKFTDKDNQVVNDYLNVNFN